MMHIRGDWPGEETEGISVVGGIFTILVNGDAMACVLQQWFKEIFSFPASSAVSKLLERASQTCWLLSKIVSNAWGTGSKHS
jgi:hypothetical protein